MATVRITNEIRWHVKNKLEELYRGRIERKEKELKTLDIGNVCYQHYIPAEYRELAKRLNDDKDGPWLEPANYVTVRVSYRKKDTDHLMTEKTFPAPLNPPVPMPQRFRGFNARFQLTEQMAPYEHVKKIFLEIDNIIEERDKLISQIVDGVLTKCSTLRQVLQLWPTALDFMPDEARQRHAAKPEKRQTVVEELSIDNDVKISLMKARMLTAGG
jgi:hypothetical protein